MSSSKISALVASRICHDLINPVGALAHGVEFLEMTGANGAEIELIQDGVANASGRLRFFRIAFGVSDAAQVLSATEIKAIFEDTYADRVSVDWRVKDAKPRNELQAVFLALLCLETALPKGGHVDVSYNNGWVLVANGDTLDADEALWDPLAQGEVLETPTPQTVPFTLLPECLKSLQILPTVVITETRLSIFFD